MVAFYRGNTGTMRVPLRPVQLKYKLSGHAIMAAFEDLTPHTYAPMNWDCALLNVAWLGTESRFAVGQSSAAFIDALAELCLHPGWLHRGFHLCELCPAGTAVGARPAGNKLEYGNGQIRVLSTSGNWYAAPTLVHHYVVAHLYLPPADFAESVLSPVAVGVDHYMHRTPRLP